jgi:hypothetical protein
MYGLQEPGHSYNCRHNVGDTTQEPDLLLPYDFEVCCTRYAFILLFSGKSAFTNAQNQARATRMLASLAHKQNKCSFTVTRNSSIAIGFCFINCNELSSRLHRVIPPRTCPSRSPTLPLSNLSPHQQSYTRSSPVRTTLFQFHHVLSISLLHGRFHQHEHCSRIRSRCSCG